MIDSKVDRPKETRHNVPNPLTLTAGGLLLLTLCCAIAFVGIFDLPRNQKITLAPPAPTTNLVSPVRYVVATGRIEPVREVKISPEVSGEIIDLPVQEGQRVTKGDLLLRIKPDYYIANRDQAEGNYKSALANIDIATARLQEADAELKRNENLYHSKLISGSAFESSKAAYEVAKAQVSNAEGQLETARGSMTRAQDDLDKTTIHSPITGTVAKLNSQIGERVVGTATMAGTEVMSLADLNHMEARVEVSETDIRSLSCGKKAQLELTAFPDRSFDGTVVEMATSCDRFGPQSNGRDRDPATFEVKIRLDQAQELRPGMSVRAQIPIGTASHALAGRPANAKASG